MPLCLGQLFGCKCAESGRGNFEMFGSGPTWSNRQPHFLTSTFSPNHLPLYLGWTSWTSWTRGVITDTCDWANLGQPGQPPISVLPSQKLSKDRQRKHDAEVLDEAIETMRTLLLAPGEPAIPFGAADRLVKLLERRAKLLGLDVGSDAPDGHETPVERMERQLRERGTS